MVLLEKAKWGNFLPVPTNQKVNACLKEIANMYDGSLQST
jgi:hypothetical protein